jgi:DNA polymerase-4
MLWNYANGIEESEVAYGSSGHSIIKGVGNSTTVHFDVENKETAYWVIFSLVETVSMRLRYSGLCGRVISIYLKKADSLTTYSHQMKIQTPTDCTNAIFAYCKILFDECWKGEPIRQIGVRVSELTTGDHVQLSVFEKDWEKQKKVDRVVDQIRMKFGPDVIIRNNFLWSGLAPLQGGLSEDSAYPVMTSIL